MQGKNQGVQKRVLDLNSKALCVPCGSHTLNLVGDAAKSSVASVSLFGLLQRLYSLFSSSVHRWTIIKDHVKTFTVKALSTTRWECRIEAVKAVRYQFPDILKALTALEDHAKEKRDEEDLQGDADMAFSALVTVKERFSHMETFFQLYGFLYSKDLMKSTKEAGRLGECCQKLEQATEDVEAQDLRLEVEGAVQSFPTDISTPSDMLNHIYKENIVELYPNLSIALRPLLTLPVNTVASVDHRVQDLRLKWTPSGLIRYTGPQCFPLPPGGPRGVPRPAGICNPSSQFWVYPVVSYQLDVPGKPPRGGILIRCPNHLNWLLSTPRSSGSTLSSLRMSELLTLSLRLSPATLRRKLIWAACIPDLLLSIDTSVSEGQKDMKGSQKLLDAQMDKAEHLVLVQPTLLFKDLGEHS
ncbi:hypothetical protein N1851_006880 [Merluccius polli]|uniref:Uncharacterized protein n=1 Tax=Merluccius polli TaxID=89951 RepID=A0AA47N3V8_MERPO|nr:hypothetical protein N1851_006880 [Merluccius polli]